VSLATGHAKNEIQRSLEANLEQISQALTSGNENLRVVLNFI
jgi:hypothetical protein